MNTGKTKQNTSSSFIVSTKETVHILLFLLPCLPHKHAGFYLPLYIYQTHITFIFLCPKAKSSTSEKN